MPDSNSLETLKSDIDYDRLIAQASPALQRYIRTMEQENALLRQELLTLGFVPLSIPAEAWEHLVKTCGKKTLEDVYTDIGLGKRLSFVVAQALTRAPGKAEEPPAPANAKLGTLSLPKLFDMAKTTERKAKAAKKA